MSEFATSMTYPFIACLLLAGIHVYLGIHVIERKVIFVDLALAQIAALGAVFAIMWGFTTEENPWVVKAFSFGLAVAAAAVFASTRTRRERVPQEATIGIAYAAAVAASVLASSNLPHGADELRQLLAGSILWVTPEMVAWAALVYASVGLFHFVFRRQLLAVSLDAEAARQQGIDVRRWDFLFYVSFAVVVTSSVAIAGVLLVFAFLVVPAVVAVLLSDDLRTRLFIGWAVGALVSVAGVSLSYAADLPSGPVIVLALVAFLVVVASARMLGADTVSGSTLAKAAGGVAAAAVFVWALTSFRSNDAMDIAGRVHAHDIDSRLSAVAEAKDSDAAWQGIHNHLEELLSDESARVRAATAALLGSRAEEDFLDVLHGLLVDIDESVRESAVRAVRAIHSARSVPPLLAAAGAERDPYLKTELAESVVELGDPRGIPILISIADSSGPRQVRKEAYEHVSHHVALKMPAFDEERGGIAEWWAKNGPSLVWNAETLLYERPL